MNGQTNLPSEKWFLAIARFIDFDNVLGIFMHAATIRVLLPDGDIALRRFVIQFLKHIGEMVCSKQRICCTQSTH